MRDLRLQAVGKPVATPGDAFVETGRVGVQVTADTGWRYRTDRPLNLGRDLRQRGFTCPRQVGSDDPLRLAARSAASRLDHESTLRHVWLDGLEICSGARRRGQQL